MQSWWGRFGWVVACGAIWSGPIAIAYANTLQPYGVFRGTVAAVVDGDTVRLDSGHTVRLLDINTPELAHSGRAAEPLGPQAQAALRAMVLGQRVAVQLGARVYDPYDRVLGHLFLERDTPNRWVNGGMVAGGYAHVYTFPDNRLYGRELLVLEAQARATSRGIWGLQRWQTRQSDQCCDAQDMGKFMIVRGVVRHVARVQDISYLNFGDNWRTDFSIAIPRKQDKLFRKDGLKNYQDLLGQTIMVRGVVMPVNGALIRVTHPEQILVEGR
jgi:micrococcal nuclease